MFKMYFSSTIAITIICSYFSTSPLLFFISQTIKPAEIMSANTCHMRLLNIAKHNYNGKCSFLL